jgi:hypothetical protein
MEASGEFCSEGVVDGAMFPDTREPGQGVRAYMYGIMCLAAGCGPCMPMVEVRLIDYFEQGGRECC